MFGYKRWAEVVGRQVRWLTAVDTELKSHSPTDFKWLLSSTRKGGTQCKNLCCLLGSKTQSPVFPSSPSSSLKGVWSR